VETQWYYAKDGDRLGPFSGKELSELAVCGLLQPTDTVWRAGIDKGVSAKKVKNLFLSSQRITIPMGSGVVPAAFAPSPAKQSAAIIPTAPGPLELPPPATSVSAPLMPVRLRQIEAKKGRATAVRGVIIVSQDGRDVRYRKKCTKCGQEDSSTSRMPIRHGTTRMGFFCPKCRKLMQVEIQGAVGTVTRYGDTTT
jgi:hypothetical protein